MDVGEVAGVPDAEEAEDTIAIWSRRSTATTRPADRRRRS